MKKFLLILFTSIGTITLLRAQDDRAIDALMLDANYAAAISEIDAKLSSAPDKNRIIALENKKAESLIRLGRFEEAEKLLRAVESKAVSTKFQLAVTQTNYGLLYLNQGRNDLALDVLQKALTNFGEEGKSESLDAAQALAHLGNLYRATGKYVQAEEQLTMALANRQKQFNENHELIAASYNDLGLVYSATDPDKSLDYYEKALAIYENLHGADHPKIAIANTNTGYVYRQLGLLGDAVINFESALAIWDKVYQRPHPSKAFILFNLGETYLKIGDRKAAGDFYNQARIMYEACYGKKHPELARVLNALGNMELASGRYDNALAFYQQALQTNVADFIQSDISTNPELRNFYDGNVLLYSLLNKAQALESRHYATTLKFKDLSLALQTLAQCDILIDKLRQQIINEEDKIALGIIANEVYADGVRIANEAGKIAFKKRQYFEQAFYFAEKSKSAVLLEAIADANAKEYSGIPSDLLDEEKDIKAAITLCAQRLAQKPSPEEEKYLRETSFTLNRNYESFIRKLEAQFPDYFNLKYNTAAPSIPQLQSRLDRNTAILSYFTDDKNNRLYIFRITQNKFRIEEHALPEGFDRLIRGLRNSLFYNEGKTYHEACSELSALLVPKHISSVKNLIIVPTGRMSTIPFDALFAQKVNEAQDYNSLPYLIKTHGIRYEFSTGLMLQKTNQKQSITTPSILLCAPVSFSFIDLGELPGTETEVNDIARLFNGKDLKTSVYLRQHADEKLIKSDDVKQYSYLHFATHGLVDEVDPELSRIFLQSDDNEDGNLFAGEIYNLQLNASLVTLSACQTGLGKISKGEGVIGLSRALVYAGAQNIIVSFWSVADASTALLMKDFYQQMLENQSAGFSENLRKAKLNMINSKAYAAPYYWAPFVLIGSDKSLD